MTKRAKYSVLGVVLIAVAVIGGIAASKRSPALPRCASSPCSARPRGVGDGQRPGRAAHQGRHQHPISRARNWCEAGSEGGGHGPERTVPPSDRPRHRPSHRASRRRPPRHRPRRNSSRRKANLDFGRRSAYDRSMQIKKANPQLISDEQMEQLRTTVDVNTATGPNQRSPREWISPRPRWITRAPRSTRPRSLPQCQGA